MQASGPLGFHFPALTLKQDRQTPARIPQLANGRLPQSRPKRLMTCPMMLVNGGSFFEPELASLPGADSTRRPAWPTSQAKAVPEASQLSLRQSSEECGG